MELSVTSLLSHLSLSLIKNKKGRKSLPSVRALIPSELFGQFIDKSYQYPSRITKVLDGTAKSLQEIDDSPNLIFNNVQDELRWAKAIILRNVGYISRCITLSQEFSDSFILSKYSEAEEILDEIEKTTGYSLWMIKTKIGFLQMVNGLEAQKRYSQFIKEQTSNGSLPAYFAYWASVRNEETVTKNRFSTNFTASVEKLSRHFEEIHLNYFYYHILPEKQFSINDYANFLSIEFNKSLFDYYEAFVALARAITSSDDSKLKSQLMYSLRSICKEVKDSRLDLYLSLLSTEDTITFADEKFELIFRSYKNESFEEAFEIYKDTLQDRLTDPMTPIIGAFIMSAVDTSNQDSGSESQICLVTDITGRLSNIIRLGFNGAANDTNSLQKIALNFSTFAWASAIKLVLENEELLFVDLSSEGVNETLKIPFAHPLFLERLSNSPLYSRYARLCGNLQIPQTEQEISFNKKEFISFAPSMLLDAVEAFEKEDFGTSLSCLSQVVGQSPPNFRRRAEGLRLMSYLRQQDYRKACSEICTYYLNAQHQHLSSPISEFVNDIVSDNFSWSRVSDLIDLSIVLDAYSKHISNDCDAFRRYAYEDFLSVNGMNRPSELFGKEDLADLEKTIYYLRFVCIEVNMDTSIVFDGAKDVAAERLTICKQLCDLDPDNYNIYQKEIKELIRSQVISSRIQEIDESRIFIDLPGIKGWAIKELSESFARYISYLQHGIEIEPSHRKDEKPKTNNSSGNNWKAMSVPSNEVFALIKYIIYEIREKYISVDYGLDRFLSTRIRHGFLENQLRRPMQVHNLITKKTSKEGPYLPNHHWLEQLEGNPLTINQIDTIFSTFSESYDALISKLNNELIQIKSEKKTSGLFNFSIQEEFIEATAQTITPSTNFPELIERLLQQFESSLQLNLVYVREELNTKYKREARELLNKLQLNVEYLSYDINVSNLLAAISQARTDLQATFNKIIEWFVPSSTGSSTPYTIEDVVNVAEAIIKDGNANFSAKIKTSSTAIDHLMQGNLPIFVDILSNIFDNIVKRSSLEVPLGEIYCSLDEISLNVSILSIKVENNLGEGVDRNSLQNELVKKKLIFESGNYNQYLAKDQNSGLFKIRRSLDDFNVIEFSIKSRMDFGVENDKFYISLYIPYRIFKLEADESEISN